MIMQWLVPLLSTVVTAKPGICRPVVLAQLILILFGSESRDLGMSLDVDIILAFGSFGFTVFLALALRLGFRRGRDLGDK